MLAETEKAGANFAVGSQTDAVAVAAKRLADRRDDPDFASALPKRPAGGCLGEVASGERDEGHVRADLLDDFATGDNMIPLPRLSCTQWHELDEAHNDTLLGGKLGQAHDLVVVEAANDHCVKLYRGEAQRLGRADRLEHFR